MIAGSARKLADAVEIGNGNIERLLDFPGEDDTIRIGGLLYRASPETSLLELVREAPESHQSPDRVFLQLIHRALDQVRSMTNQSVGRRGFEEAIDALILMQPEDPDDEREPSQFIADQRFLRGMSAALRQARERTGQPVSERGLREMIAFLERLIEDRDASADGVVAEVIRFPEGTPRHQLPTNGNNGEGRDDRSGDDQPRRTMRRMAATARETIHDDQAHRYRRTHPASRRAALRREDRTHSRRNPSTSAAAVGDCRARGLRAIGTGSQSDASHSADPCGERSHARDCNGSRRLLLLLPGKLAVRWSPSSDRRPRVVTGPHTGR